MTPASRLVGSWYPCKSVISGSFFFQNINSHRFVTVHMTGVE